MRPQLSLAAALLLLGAAAGQATPLECVVNGDFEQELEVGWQQLDEATNAAIARNADLDDDPDQELGLRFNNGVGEISVWQRFAIPNTDLDIATTIRARASGSGGAWVAAGFRLGYLDRNMVVLGRTFIGRMSSDCPWFGSPTLHLVTSAHDEWEQYSFNLNDELANLPGVDPSEVAYLEVEVFSVADNC
jgi:hypothetical protein